MYIEKLMELNKRELISEDGYKYTITTYEDISRIEYLEKDKEDGNKYKLINSYDIPSCHDIQVCERVIEMRKAFKN